MKATYVALVSVCPVVFQHFERTIRLTELMKSNSLRRTWEKGLKKKTLPKGKADLTEGQIKL